MARKRKKPSIIMYSDPTFPIPAGTELKVEFDKIAKMLDEMTTFEKPMPPERTLAEKLDFWFPRDHE